MQGPVSISVSVPNLDEGNLRGQVLQIPVQSLSDTVGSLKEQIAGELQLPANKQKLSVRTSFLKDNLTLAYYNVGPGVVINLTLRERGGRKKWVNESFGSQCSGRLSLQLYISSYHGEPFCWILLPYLSYYFLLYAKCNHLCYANGILSSISWYS